MVPYCNSKQLQFGLFFRSKFIYFLKECIFNLLSQYWGIWEFRSINSFLSKLIGLHSKKLPKISTEKQEFSWKSGFFLAGLRFGILYLVLKKMFVPIFIKKNNKCIILLHMLRARLNICKYRKSACSGNQA